MNIKLNRAQLIINIFITNCTSILGWYGFELNQAAVFILPSGISQLILATLGTQLMVEALTDATKK